MDFFDRRDMQDGDIAFFLDTNDLVPAAAAIQFLELFQPEATGFGPGDYTLEIIQLKAGSLGGWLRPHYDKKLVRPERFERIRNRYQAAMSPLNPVLDQVATQRAANRIGAENLGVSQQNLRMTAAMIVATVITPMLTSDANPQSVAATILMASGVSKIDLWTIDTNWRVTRDRVPMYRDGQTQRIAVGMATETDQAFALKPGVGPVELDGGSANPDRELPRKDSFPSADAEAGVPWPTNRGEPHTDVDQYPGIPLPEQRHSPMDSSSETTAGSPSVAGQTQRPRPWRRQKASRIGTFVERGDTWTLFIDEGSNKGQTVGVLPPDGADIIGGQRYRVDGDMYFTDGATPLIIAATLVPV